MFEDVLKAIWAAMNSPIGITVVVSMFLWTLNKVYSLKPTWAKFEGTIIAGIKYAEKAIDDDTDNKAMSRLDTALRYVLRIYQESGKKNLSGATIDSIKEGIQIKHAQLEATGTLTSKPKDGA